MLQRSCGYHFIVLPKHDFGYNDSEYTLRYLATILLLVLLNTTHAWSNSYLKTDAIHLSIENDSSRISEWRARNRKTEHDWTSLLTLDTSGNVLSRHLGIEGLNFSDSTWHQLTDEEGLMLKAHSKDGTVAVEWSIRPSEIDYRLRFQIKVINETGKSIEFPEGLQLVLGPGLGEYPTETFGIAQKLYSFVEPIFSINGKVEPLNPQSGEISVGDSNNDLRYIWYGLHSRYFALLIKNKGGLVPESISFRSAIKTESIDLPNRYLPELVIDLNIHGLLPQQIVYSKFLIFSGPKSVKALSDGDTNFSGVLFYSLWNWMQALSMGLLWLLGYIHKYIHNWGASILMLAVIVRLLMYPLAQKVLSSQKKYAEVQKTLKPKIKEIKKKFRGGQQSEKIIRLYKEHQVSPLAGLKPLLIVLFQIPIFIALFHVLGSSFELRNASFLWIKTLAEPDQLIALERSFPFLGSYFNVLPLLLAVSTFLTIKLSPAPTAEDKLFNFQNIFLIMMAISFFFVFYSFPSGMVLYWTIANVLHVMQYKIATSKIETN